MKKTIAAIKAMKGSEKISMLTAYDYTMARAVDTAGIDIVLVGDSLGMVVLGYENVQSVTIEDTQRCTGAVVRGTENALIVADMPVNTFNTKEDAALHAESLIKLGADAVKIEKKPDIAAFLVEQGIQVMGHVGLTPHTAQEFKVQGKDQETAQNIIAEAQALDKAGCFAIVIECVPTSLGKEITEAVSVPTIGIGAGIDCDGQVLVSHDLLGLYDRFSPKFVKKYANLGKEMEAAFSSYKKEVQEKQFPAKEHSFN